jgi:spore maturation protein CgeB
MLRILSFSTNWQGSDARAGVEALRRLGCQVFDIDIQTYFPSWNGFALRAARRLLWRQIAEDVNKRMLDDARRFRPDIFLAFLGADVHPATLRAMRDLGIRLYNYYPDTSAFTHGKVLPKSLPEYDCVFYTKFFWYGDVTRVLPLRAGHFVPLGYDPMFHRSVKLDDRDILDFGCDVSFIAVYTRYKENILSGLAELRPDLSLRIWGPGWERCKSANLRRWIQGTAVIGDQFVRAVSASKISLAIMTGPRVGASSGDLTTARSFNLPACGAFMLHERNHEILELYREDEEIACFDSPGELADKIDYFLAHPAERERIAKAGYARAVPAFSYDNRMADLLRWHFESRGIESEKAIPAC